MIPHPPGDVLAVGVEAASGEVGGTSPRPHSTIGLTDEQRAMRRLGIGGSDIPAICGLSANRGRLTVYREKVEGWQQPSTEEMDFGHRFEDMAVRWFQDLTDLEVVHRQASVEHPDHPWRRATVDGFVHGLIPTGETLNGAPIYGDRLAGVLEIKSFNVVDEGDVKADVLAQVLWQLHVTGLPTGWVFGLVGHAPQIRQVHAADHADNIAWLAEQAERFWFDHVVAGIPPAPTAADLPMLEGIPAVEDTTVELATEVAEWWAERTELKARMKADEKRTDQLDALIREAIGTATVGTIAGVPILTATTTTRAGLDTDAVRAAFPELAACRSLHTSTTFRTLRNPPKHPRRTR